MLDDPMTGPDGNDTIFSVTTDNCGRIFAVTPDGKVLAELDITPFDEEDISPFIQLTTMAANRLIAEF